MIIAIDFEFTKESLYVGLLYVILCASFGAPIVAGMMIA